MSSVRSRQPLPTFESLGEIELMANVNVAKNASKPNNVSAFARMGKFIRESYVETIHKSSWPTLKELRQFTLVVIFAIAAVAVWTGGIDFLLTELTSTLGRGGQ